MQTTRIFLAPVACPKANVDLEKVAYFIPSTRLMVMYEPDQFPGAICRMENPEVVFLVFSTGKLVCVGAKYEEDIYRAVSNLITILEENKLITWSMKNIE